MIFRTLSELFSREIAGRRALEWTGGLSRFHREPGIPGHQKALDYIVEEVEQLGLDEVEAREYAYDGRRVYYSTWATVPQWTPHAAVLEVVAPERRLLADFSEIPIVLGIRSASTPPAGVTAELVDVGAGNLSSHYAEKGVRGKIVLCDPNGQLGLMAIEKARLHGAVGVVICNTIDHPPEVTREDRPDHIGHLWMTWWFTGAPHDFANDIFSFSISARQLGYLRRLLARGRVTLRAVVDAEFSGGNVRQISGLIRGSELPEEEVVYLGHADHPWPGANDNASGCGLMMEQANTIMSLIRKGLLPRPRRSIRFLWDVHVIGGVMWAEDHPGWGSRVRAGYSPDSVGVGVSGGTYMRLLRTSDTRPSYLNDLTSFLAERLPLEWMRSHRMRLEPIHPVWHFKEASCALGLDAGPINDLSIGAHAMGIGGFLYDKAYHTDRDTYARLDAQELERAGWLLTMAGYIVANADQSTARLLAHVVAARARTRAAKMVGDAVIALEGTDTSEEACDAVRDWLDRITYRGRLDTASLGTVTALGDGSALAAIVGDLTEELNSAFEGAKEGVGRWAKSRFGAKILSSKERTDDEMRASSLVPVRKFDGPFNAIDIRTILAHRIGWDRIEWLSELQNSQPYPSPGYRPFAGIFYAMDGKANLLDIAKAVKFEYQEDPGLSFYLHMADDLVDANFIDLVETREKNP